MSNIEKLREEEAVQAEQGKEMGVDISRLNTDIKLRIMGQVEGEFEKAGKKLGEHQAEIAEEVARRVLEMGEKK